MPTGWMKRGGEDKEYMSEDKRTSDCVVLRMYQENLSGFVIQFLVHAAIVLFFLRLLILPVSFPNLSSLKLSVIAFIAGAAWGVWINSRIKMKICEQGLEFYGMEADDLFASIRKPLFCRWESLSHFEVITHINRGGKTRTAVLYLKKPLGVTIDIGKVIPVAILHDDNGKRLLNRREYDVIDPDALASSYFGRTYLAKYAPHVIEAARKQHREAEAYVHAG